MHIRIECTRCLIIDKLTELSQSGKYAMIVMGASGESQLKSIYYGSTTVAVASKSEVPVVVIPNQPFNFEINHVSLLTYFKAAEFDNLNEFQEIIGLPLDFIMSYQF